MIEMRKEGDVFLRQLISQLPENIIMVEIGCYQGESTVIFASFSNIEKIYAVDPWLNGYDSSDEASYQFPMTDVEKAFDNRTNSNKKIKKMKLKSEEAVELFNDRSLDFVYIDGNHTYESTKQDILSWVRKVKSNLFIGGHDYLNPCGVKQAVDEIFGSPDMIYGDSSWLKKVVRL